ncbi:MAG: excinuclease ABC subunit UvrC [Mollicutes bacterium]|nr:excinuclease ABC subunit UvrC [Mollicutes bacterium]
MFKEELKLVPHLPGSYQMINKEGIIIYVGKAKNLNKRLRSYFRGTTTGKTALMVNETNHFEYIVTKNEVESFLLEINLIKKHNPKYNILLKDDKSYPYIEYISKPYPTLKISRYTKIRKKAKKYIFGPYPNAYAARRVVNLLNRLYPLKKCSGNPKKLCLYYHIGECLGYCVNKVSDDEIIKIENDILSFLKGNDKLLIDKIMEKIKVFSNNLNFEKALELKNELEYIKVISTKQQIELRDNINRDVISYYFLNGYLSIEIFFVRNGKLIGNYSKIINTVSEDEINEFIYSFYEKHELPQEILVSKNIDNILLEELLKVKFITPIRGNKKKLLDLCFTNAKLNLEKEIESFKNNEKRTFLANERLKEILNLSNLNTIEAFDNSNLFGSYSVSGMVVFKNGLPSKKDYRKFKISLDKNDDYHMMKEVIYRRYYRLLIERKSLPDLIIVDGAVNQINACKESLRMLGLNIPVCGLKKDDKHKTKSLITTNLEEISLAQENDVFHYLTRIQEEVHNFTINYHKKLRSKGSLTSVLDNVVGIGEKRKKLLLKRYKNLDNIKESEIEDLEKIIPKNIAIELKKYLASLK